MGGWDNGSRDGLANRDASGMMRELLVDVDLGVCFSFRRAVLCETHVADLDSGGAEGWTACEHCCILLLLGFMIRFCYKR